MYKPYNKLFKESKRQYRIITKDGRVKFAGTGQESWFVDLEKAKKLASPTDMVYEYDENGERLWEVL